MNVYLIKEQDKYEIVKAAGFIPKNSEGIVSPDIPVSDYPYLKSREVVDPVNPQIMIKEIYVDPQLKLLGDIEHANAETDKKWSDIRDQRDTLLTQTDWTQMPDSPLSASDKAAYADYRQALRDLPAGISDIDNVVWPTKP